MKGQFILNFGSKATQIIVHLGNKCASCLKTLVIYISKASAFY